MGKPKPKPGSVDAMIAEWRAAGLDFSEGKTASLPEITPETNPQAISRVCGSTHSPADGVVVDVPPSVNNLFAGGRGGKRYASKGYKVWVKENGWKLAGLAAVKEYPVAVILTVECKLRVGRDLDNLAKAVLDTMHKVGVIVDDDWRYVSSVTVCYRPCDGTGVRVNITRENQ